MSLVEINRGVMELEVSKFLRVTRPAGARRNHRIALLILVRGRPNVVRIVSCSVQVLVLAYGQGLVVQPLAHRCGSGPLRHLILVMVLMVWRRIDGLVPPISRVQSAVWGLFSSRVGLCS